MIEVLPFNKKVREKIRKHQLEKKIKKQLTLFAQNPYYPSLHTELLVPKEYGIYSLRIDIHFRALFIYRDDKKSIEVLNITLHYQ